MSEKGSWAGEAAQQQPGHSQIDDRLGGSGQVFIVLAEAPEPASQAKVRSTTHRRGTTAKGDTIGGVAPGGSQRRCRPPSWRDTTWKLMPALLGPVEEGAAVAAIDPAVPQPRKPASVQAPEQLGGAVAVTHIGGGHTDLADQPEGVDQQVALAAIDLLGAVVAVRPPRSVVLTL